MIQTCELWGSYLQPLGPPCCQQSLSSSGVSLVDWISPSPSSSLSHFLSPLIRFSNTYTLSYRRHSPSLTHWLQKLKMVLIPSGFWVWFWTHSLQLAFFFLCSFFSAINSVPQTNLLTVSAAVVAGWEVHVLPVRRGSTAGGSAHACHHGGVWLACFFYRHFQVPRVPGLHQHTEDNCGSQVMNILLHMYAHTLFSSLTFIYGSWQD